ncbi:MAG: hypothetical protein KDD70_04515 [Bdellovibrionales bacterium]|nr:hypothetical protein [Bdellovibrionales bacterium]
MTEASKFCGNCGSPREQVASFSVDSPCQNDARQEESYGRGADAIIAFVGGFYFKALIAVLGVVGIGYAYFNGGIRTSHIPSPAESYMMQKRWSPTSSNNNSNYNGRGMAPRQTDSSSVTRRRQAYEQQRSNINSTQPSNQYGY